jgi:hypothetical protein
MRTARPRSLHGGEWRAGGLAGRFAEQPLALGEHIRARRRRFVAAAGEVLEAVDRKEKKFSADGMTEFPRLDAGAIDRDDDVAGRRKGEHVRGSILSLPPPIEPPHLRVPNDPNRDLASRRRESKTTRDFQQNRPESIRQATPRGISDRHTAENRRLACPVSPVPSHLFFQTATCRSPVLHSPLRFSASSISV